MIVFAALLTAAQYGFGYAILRLGGAGRLLAWAALGVGLTALLLGSPNNPFFFPSAGGVRFVPPFVVVTLALSAARRSSSAASQEGSPRSSLEPAISPKVLVATGVASLWSVEAFGYTGAALVVLVAVDAAIRSTSLRSGARLIGLDFVRLAGACVAAQVVFVVATRILAGGWPDYGWYLSICRPTLDPRADFGRAVVNRLVHRWPVHGIFGRPGHDAGLRSGNGTPVARPAAGDRGQHGSGIGLLTYWVNRSVDVTLPSLALPALITAGAVACLGSGLKFGPAAGPIWPRLASLHG